MKQWWKEEVVYQIYPKSFMDSNDDGIGDVKGIISKLDYLKKLGITMIWVCPIYQSPMDDNGYDISDYCDIHPDFGTMADVELLIKEAKKRDIKLIMDLVINHTSDEHEWFKEALANPYSDKRDYYIFKEGKNNQPPTNWRSVFGGSVWEKVPNEDNMYYFHAFSKKQPDLNWENPKLRQAIYDMICFWLEKGIAGFRVDAINFIKKNQAWPDGKVDGADGLSACFPFSRNVPGIETFFAELRKETFDKYQCMTVAEAVGVPYDKLDIFTGENGCFSMLFDFNYTNLDINENEEWFHRQNWTVKQLKEGIFLSQKEIRKIGWSAPFIENHDQPRAIDKWMDNPKNRTPQFAKMLGNLYFFLQGTPFIYQGQELGIVNNERQSIDEFDDLSTLSQYERSMQEGYTAQEALALMNRRSRDNSRAPMTWTKEKNGGFTKGTPWLKVNEFYQDYAAESQVDDKESVFSYYQQMIALHENPLYHDTLVYGEFEPMETEDNVIAYVRKSEDMSILVINNFQDVATSIDVEDCEVLLSNDAVYHEAGKIILQPFQSIVAVKK